MATPHHIYTHGHHESVTRSYQWRTANNSAAYLLPHLAPGMSLLDIGCGPGTITADLAAKVAPGRVTATDLTEEAYRLAQQEARTRGQENIDFQVADVHTLNYPDDTFDIVHAHQVLQHVADPIRALRQMRRVCRPDGYVAARDGDFATFTWYPPVPELDMWLSLYRRMARTNGGEPDAGRRLLSWARTAGFTDITATASTWCFTSPDDTLWWSDTWAERIVRSDVARQLVAAGYATREDLSRIAGGWREWAQSDDAWFAAIHGEILCQG